MPAEDSDRQVMFRVAAGDRRAFQELLDRYWLRMVLYAQSMLLSRDVAEDVVQSVFVRLWEVSRTGTPVGTVSGYLYRATRNAALNEMRDTRLRSLREGEASSDAHHPVPASVVEGLHVRQEVGRAIEALPERRREIFVLSRFHGFSHRQIAEAMGISPQTVSNQMSSALDQLRDSLSHLRDQS